MLALERIGQGTSWPWNKLAREQDGPGTRWKVQVGQGTSWAGNGLAAWEQLGQGTGWGERVGQEQVAGNELGVNRANVLCILYTYLVNFVFYF